MANDAAAQTPQNSEARSPALSRRACFFLTKSPKNPPKTFWSLATSSPRLALRGHRVGAVLLLVSPADQESFII